MKVELITMWYNEEDLAPFFLKHYSWVDKIHLIIDADTNDKTLEIAQQYHNVEIEYFKFPDMMDDQIKVNKLNECYSLSDADWVIIVDSDEFIFNDTLGEDCKSYLESINDSAVVYCRLWNVYRHVTEKDLDLNVPIAKQRQYGIMDMKGQDATYTKPSIIRGGQQAFLTLGNHFIFIDSPVGNYCLPGAHWAMADVDIAIKRRIYGRKTRQSQINLAYGFTAQHHRITEGEIRQECEEMSNCEKVLGI